MRLLLLAGVLAAVAAVLIGTLAHLGAPPGEHAALPEHLRPYRPVPIRVANGFGVLLDSIGVDTFNLLLTEPQLTAAACLARDSAWWAQLAVLPLPLTGGDGGCDFGPDTFRAGLRALLSSYRTDSRLTFLGKFIARGLLVQWLTTRARLVEARRNLPPPAKRPAIDRPVVIAGLPRTGTTFLHNLLSQDRDTFRGPVHWEYMEPIPPPKTSVEKHIADISFRLEQFKLLLPGVEHIHPIAVDMPEECCATMAHEFASILFESTNNVSSYTDWLLAKPDHHTVMDWHRVVLDHLQHEWAQEHPGRTHPRWVLKTPWFLALLDDIRAQYDDAVFVMTHRPPVAVLASVSSVHAKFRTAGSDHIDMRGVGETQVHIFEQLLRRALDVRRRWRDDPKMNGRVADVTLADLQKDPIAAVERVYTALGMKLTDTAKASMRKWLAEAKIVHGKHKPTLDDFSLSKEELMRSPTFREYCGEYNLTC